MGQAGSNPAPGSNQQTQIQMDKSKQSKVIGAGVMSFLLMSLVYFMISFIELSVNPSDWDSLSRLFLVAVVLYIVNKYYDFIL